MTMPDTTVALLEQPIAESLAAGTLVLVPDATLREVGSNWPVYITRAAWDRHVALTPSAVEMACDEGGRLYDVMWMYSRAAKVYRDDGPMRFAFYGVTDRPFAHLCDLFAFVVVQDEEPNVVLVTAEEALGERHGALVNRYGNLIGLFADEPED